MPSVQTVNIASLQHYIEVAGASAQEEFGSRWFRGVGSSEFTLSPSIHRNASITSAESLFAMEEKFLSRFKERSIPYLTHRLSDEWEFLFLMQHYGMPTRLLDWTENPLTALFFGVSSVARNPAGEPDKDVAVWVLSPVTWNETIFSSRSYRGGALSPSDTMIAQSYKPGGDLRYINEHPVAILGIHNSPRIVAQRGSFCLFGKSLKPMEQIFSEGTFHQETLKKLIIPKANVDGLLRQLISMGVSDAAVYPDLEGLARETKRIFGYKV